MTKSELAKRIIASVGEPGTARISDFNRKVLSEIASERFSGEVDDKAVETAEELLQAFLNDTWPEEPEAHKYVIGSCLALSFLLEKPMHPQETVQYITRLENGKERFYCRFHEKGTLCDFCAAHTIEELH